jgi:polar amino acid transport system substrate-binding protein
MSPGWAGASALALVVLLAGCGSTAQPVPPRPAVSPVAPRPAGVKDPAVIPSASASAPLSCDPRASLRPPATGQVAPGTKMTEIIQRGRIVVGVDQNTYLFGFRDPGTGQLTGFDIDIAKEIAAALFGDTNPDRIQFRTISSAERIPAIQKGDVDIVVRTMTMTCERLEQVAFSTEYFTAGQRVLVLRDSSATGLKDLGGKKVCATAGSTSLATIAKAEPHPVPVSVVDWTDCLVMLQQRQVEAISTDNTILAGLAAQDPNAHIVGAPITEEPYGVAMAKDATDLVRFVNSVLDKIRSNGRWRAIYAQWLSALGSTPDPPVATYRD